jgi:glycosyltransferase involved in cell wall biosynthesis
MKIAIDARIINSSTGRYVERLLHHLQAIDTTNEYIVLIRKKDVDFWKPSAANFRTVVADFDNYSVAEQIGFKQLLDMIGADLVHFCMPQQPAWYGGAVVTTIHDLTLLNTYNSDKNWFIYHTKQLVGRFLFKRIAKKSRFVLTGTEYVRGTILDFVDIPEDKVIVTLESADIPDVAPEPYTPMQNRQYLLYVGSQSDYKNIRRLIGAHQSILKSHPDLELVLVGKTDGINGKPAARNREWVRKQGFKNVTFTGFVPDNQLSWLYANARAYVFPSLMEGFGLPGLEAMLYKTPVVSSNATCLPEVYGDAAQYFDPTSVDDMAANIIEVIDNETLRLELATKGSQQVKRYSWRRMAEQTHEVYMRALR